MPREHWNDVPGDLAGSNANNLPGGFGVDDPDAGADAMVDEVTDNDVTSPTGETFTRRDNRGGSTSGTDYTDASNTGASVDPADLLEGNEGHPGAAIGFTGAEDDKAA